MSFRRLQTSSIAADSVVDPLPQAHSGVGRQASLPRALGDVVDHRKSRSCELSGEVSAATRQLLDDLADQVELLSRDLVDFETLVIKAFGDGNGNGDRDASRS